MAASSKEMKYFGVFSVYDSKVEVQQYLAN